MCLDISCINFTNYKPTEWTRILKQMEAVQFLPTLDTKDQAGLKSPQYIKEYALWSIRCAGIPEP